MQSLHLADSVVHFQHPATNVSVFSVYVIYVDGKIS